MQLALSPDTTLTDPNPKTVLVGFTVNAQDDGSETYTIPDALLHAYRRQDGSPAQSGDVLSVQPDGSWQARPRGTNGPYEKARRTGAITVYFPDAGGQVCFPYIALELPNVA